MKLKQINQNVTDAINNLIATYLKQPGIENATDINNGHCAEFAQQIAKTTPSATPMSDNFDETTHDFIHYQNRYYDAETPNGVSRWYDLPFYRRRRLANRHFQQQNKRP